MPKLVLILLLNFMITVVRICLRKARAVKPKPLCEDCTFAHIQYGSNVRRATSCTYSGGVRPVAVNVLFCTDYRARNAVVEIRPIGFIRLKSMEHAVIEVTARK